MTDDIDTDTTTDAAQTDRTESLESPADPETLLDREGVEFIEKPSEEHEHHFEMYEPIQGVAIVGVTNDADEVLLLVDREAGHAVLPYAKVDPDEDWATVARRKTEELTGVAVSLDGTERVRRKQYRPEEGGDDRETTGYDVVFSASPVGDEAATAAVGTCEDNHWEAAWVDGIPADVDADGDVADDIRLFVE